MKLQLTGLLVLLATILVSCTKIQVNNDTILGIWSTDQLIGDEDKSNPNVRKEWVFNDAYLGRFHIYQDNQIVVSIDFSWEAENDFYHVRFISAPQYDMLVKQIGKGDDVFLQSLDGQFVAKREQ